MGRDLLYKPQVQAVLPEEEGGTDKVKKTDKGQKSVEAAQKKVDAVQDAVLRRVLEKVVAAQVQQSAQAAPSSAPTSDPTSGTKAYLNAYFTKDIDSARGINLRTTEQQALRGSKEATDLRQVSIPADISIDVPNPSMMLGGLERMGLGSGFHEGLEDVLGRMGASCMAEGMTHEKLEARMAQLEAMVELRKTALARIREVRMEDKGRPSVTLEQAMLGDGMATEDLTNSGTLLIGRTASQATNMHDRVAKALGIKKS